MSPDTLRTFVASLIGMELSEAQNRAAVYGLGSYAAGTPPPAAETDQSLFLQVGDDGKVSRVIARTRTIDTAA
jgi:hypothetical protein